ncbi:MAG TPA: peroxiredoxin [Phycisphaerae bacterium]|nr:peroxiredoxin [Phycisphaerales bacterium]HRX84033.1 peroxiredoxin [Phycisphaerae bacterium]
MEELDQEFNTIQVGQPAPAFAGMALVGKEFKQLAYEQGALTIGDKKTSGHYTVLFFYPLDFTFVCPTEIIAFSERVDEFEKLNAKVIGCSVDSHFSHLAWSNTPRKEGGLGEIRYPILSDIKKEVAWNYGVLLDGGVAARGLFVIDDKGILQAYMVNNLSVGRSVDEALRLIQGYQYVAQHGEVCPADWKPGAATMKADPNGSKEYFSKAKS